MIFTVYCGAVLYIEANGGGTHISSVPQLQLLTKVTILSDYQSSSLILIVGGPQ
jgi:hypothetical protein